MAPKVSAAQLKDQLDVLLQKNELSEALTVYAQLELAEPGEPRWPHRLGDLQLRMKSPKDAIAAYERAVDLYVHQGFAARGAALAKVILGLDPSRKDVLARVDAQPMRDIRAARAVEAAPAPAPTPAVRASLVDEVFAGTDSPGRKSFVFEAPLLEPHGAAAEDEVRFVDADARGSVMELGDDDLIEEDEVLVMDDGRPGIDDLVEMPSVPLFADVPKEALTRMLELADLVELEDGQHLVRTGEPADSLFVLAEGRAEVRLPDGPAVPLAEGEIVGETCLFADMTRRADIVAKGQLRALELERATLEILVNQWPVLGGILYDLLTKRLVQNLLRHSEIFTAFDPPTRAEVGRMFEVRRAPPGTTLIAAGKRADGMYVPLLGELEMTFPDGRVVAVPPGTMLGEQSLLARTPMKSTLVSRSEVILLRLSSMQFTELASMYPAVLEHLANLAARGSFEDRVSGMVPTSV